MLTRILKFLKGYVRIRLSGYAPERFFNLCGHHGIVLWDVRFTGTEYEMCVSVGGFRSLRPLVRKTRTKVVILERYGLPFLLHRYQKRKIFVLGALCGAILLWLLSLFIWNIHIEGNYHLSDDVILSYLNDIEVVHGMRKSEVRGSEIEAGLREYFPEITWTSVEVKGTRLIVHVRESEEGETTKIADEEPADLVTSQSGTVVSMIVRSGTPAVREGASVEDGDILVASRVEIYNDDGELASVNFVHADADITIRHEEYYEESFSVQYEKKVYTGRRRLSFYVTLGRHRFTFALPGASFEQSDVITADVPLKLTENFYLPITIGKNTAQEYEVQDAVYTEEEAAARAEEELALFFEKLSIKGLQIIENNVKIDTDGEQCTASGTYVIDEEAVQESAPDMSLQTQDDSEEEGNGT
ncbi:MAG: sporulation protein YqfD [Lachnospiraceae bacterium]|nr:sporulation protein YqfD [Lachnospiraceae bacterium]